MQTLKKSLGALTLFFLVSFAQTLLFSEQAQAVCWSMYYCEWAEEEGGRITSPDGVTYVVEYNVEKHYPAVSEMMMNYVTAIINEDTAGMEDARGDFVAWGIHFCENHTENPVCDEDTINAYELSIDGYTLWGCLNAPMVRYYILQECGNGHLESPEECDDGNTEDGDGCSAECKLPFECNSLCRSEAGYYCSGGYECIVEGSSDTEGVCRLSDCPDSDTCDCAEVGECGDGVTDPPDEECDDGSHCADGTQCADDTPCSDDSECEARDFGGCSKECEKPDQCDASCDADVGCDGGYTCYAGFCRAPENPEDPNCGIGDSACGVACYDNYECGEDMECLDNQCKNPDCPAEANCECDPGGACDVACTDDSDCGEDMTCDSTSGTCRDPDCPTDNGCVCGEGTCSDTCTNDSDCGEDVTCDSTSGTCRDPDCPADNDCVCDDPGGVACNEICVNDSDCGEDMTCDSTSGTCRDPDCPTDNGCVCGEGTCSDTCTNDSDCGEDMTCDSTSGTCRDPDCPADNDCVCGEGTCSDTCTNDSDCGTGMDCENGMCRDPDCPTDDDCDCSTTDCGNGITELSNNEECDDGNSNNNDGCDNNCKKPDACDETCTGGIGCDGGYTCYNTGTIGYKCRRASNLDSSTCSVLVDGACNSTCANNSDCVSAYICSVAEGNRCRLASRPSRADCGSGGDGGSRCGNGLLEAGNGEECDDGNFVSGDGCSANCKYEPETHCDDNYEDRANTGGEACDVNASLECDEAALAAAASSGGAPNEIVPTLERDSFGQISIPLSGTSTSTCLDESEICVKLLSAPIVAGYNGDLSEADFTLTNSPTLPDTECLHPRYYYIEGNNLKINVQNKVIYKIQIGTFVHSYTPKMIQFHEDGTCSVSCPTGLTGDDCWIENRLLMTESLGEVCYFDTDIPPPPPTGATGTISKNLMQPNIERLMQPFYEKEECREVCGASLCGCDARFVTDATNGIGGVELTSLDVRDGDNYTDCSPETEGSCSFASLTNCAAGDVIFFDPYDSAPSGQPDYNGRLPGGSVILGSPTEDLILPDYPVTLVVRGADVRINGNIVYPDNAPNASLGVIVLNNDGICSGNWSGNVSVAPHVTNIVGAWYIEGSVQSTDKDWFVPGFGTPPNPTREDIEWYSTFNNQLLWKGSIFSINTVGGAVSSAWPIYGESVCKDGSGNLVQDCDWEEAVRQDLTRLREYFRCGNTTSNVNYLGDGSWKIDGCTSIDDIVESGDAADGARADEKNTSVIIRYDGRVQSNPPPGFDGLADILQRETGL